MGDGREPISCETLDDARRIAYLAVAHQRPCELIVRDAYNRIAERELIEGNRHRVALESHEVRDDLSPGKPVSCS